MGMVCCTGKPSHNFLSGSGFRAQVRAKVFVINENSDYFLAQPPSKPIREFSILSVSGPHAGACNFHFSSP